MEYDGPRALGSRCILASPEMKDARDKLNHYLRHLSLSYPFALSVPEEYVPDIFRGNSPNAQFLSTVMKARRPPDPVLRTSIFEGNRVRIHVVSHRSDPGFWQLLQRCAGLGRFPGLLHTSFNLFGDSLVCTPRDALRTFYCSGIQKLALGNFLIDKYG